MCREHQCAIIHMMGTDRPPGIGLQGFVARPTAITLCLLAITPAAKHLLPYADLLPVIVNVLLGSSSLEVADVLLLLLESTLKLNSSITTESHRFFLQLIGAPGELW